MRHLLAGFFPPWLAGSCGDKPDFMHLGRPLSIVVALARLLSVVVLTQVCYFMREGGEYLCWFLRSKMYRVQSNLIGYFFWVRKTGEAFAGEVAVCTFMSLHGYEARR